MDLSELDTPETEIRKRKEKITIETDKLTTSLHLKVNLSRLQEWGIVKSSGLDNLNINFMSYDHNVKTEDINSVMEEYEINPGMNYGYLQTSISHNGLEMNHGPNRDQTAIYFIPSPNLIKLRQAFYNQCTEEQGKSKNDPIWQPCLVLGPNRIFTYDVASCIYSLLQSEGRYIPVDGVTSTDGRVSF